MPVISSEFFIETIQALRFITKAGGIISAMGLPYRVIANRLARAAHLPEKYETPGLKLRNRDFAHKFLQLYLVRDAGG